MKRKTLHVRIIIIFKSSHFVGTEFHPFDARQTK